ncbi:MAG TPA: hypothetical protein VJH03_17065 [Blastocatellia bacterium]|nr:hypothetical protein [Blastocatellia bacterium]
MKKANREDDELRPDYKRSDFGEMVRGKYASRVAHETNVVVVEPDLPKAFPNDEAVNVALRELLEVTKSNARLSTRPTGRGKRRRAN